MKGGEGVGIPLSITTTLCHYILSSCNILHAPPLNHRLIGEGGGRTKH